MRQRTFLRTEISRRRGNPSLCIHNGTGKKRGRALKTDSRRPSFFREGVGFGNRLLASGSCALQRLLTFSFEGNGIRVFPPPGAVRHPAAGIPGYSGGTAAESHRIPCFSKQAAYSRYHAPTGVSTLKPATSTLDPKTTNMVVCTLLNRDKHLDGGSHES